MVATLLDVLSCDGCTRDDAVPATSRVPGPAAPTPPTPGRGAQGDMFEEETIGAPASSSKRPPQVSSYLDLASIPGYDPASLLGWRLTFRQNQMVSQQVPGLSGGSLGTKTDPLPPMDSSNRTRRFTEEAMKRMGILIMCPDPCPAMKYKDCPCSGACTKENVKAFLRSPGHMSQVWQEAHVCQTEDASVQTSMDSEEFPVAEAAQESNATGRRHSTSSQTSCASYSSQRSSAPRRRSVPSWPPPQTAALAGSLKPRRRSTCSVSSITDSATTSSFRGVLNTRAVLQDLEGSEEYEYGRLLPILLDMERESPGELCVRQFLAENCEISVSLMEALPFLRSLELPTYQLSQEFRSSAVFRHFLLVLQELSVSDSTCEQIFRKLSRGGGASIQNCRQNAQQLCIARFEANLPWKEWDEILQAAFEGVGDHADHGDRVSYAQWAIGCRRCVWIVRLIITLRLVS